MSLQPQAGSRLATCRPDDPIVHPRKLAPRYCRPMRKLLISSGFALILGASAALTAAPQGSPWEIGPIIRGKNYSVGMPLRPAPTRSGWFFDFPVGSREAGHVHYVTFDPGRLSEASQIVVRYRVDAAPGTRFVPQEKPNRAGTVSLFLQRRGDNWSARGQYRYFRWYAPSHSVREITPGVHEMAVRLDDPEWIAVVGGQRAGDHPEAFRAALAQAGRAGLVFGSSSARGHGVFATAPARFELLSFRIE